MKFSPIMIEHLPEPHWLRMLPREAVIYIIIDGGDAAGSYRAVFTVRGGIVVERLVAHGEFRHEIWERTMYHDDFDEHPERYKNM